MAETTEGKLTEGGENEPQSIAEYNQFSAYADAESFRQGMALLEEFNEAVDSCNARLKEAIEIVRQPESHDERLEAADRIFRNLANVAFKAGIRGDALLSLSNLFIAIDELPQEMREKLSSKMGKAPSFKYKRSTPRRGNEKGGGQKRSVLRTEFLIRQAVVRDDQIADTDQEGSEAEVNRSIADTCGHPKPKTVSDNYGSIYDDIIGSGPKKLRLVYDQNRNILERMLGGNRKQNAQTFLKLTVSNLPPCAVNRTDPDRNKQKKKEESERKERDRREKYNQKRREQRQAERRAKA